MIKIGDRVKFVSDVGVGKVVKITGSTIDVDIEDGFVMPCNISELVVVQEEDEIAAIKSIGVGDERPGKKGKSAPQKKAKVEIKGKKEPAYAKYGKISLIDNYKDSEDDDDDDDFDDSYLDLNRINDIYVRNKAAADQREREFEEARIRQEKAKLLVTESSKEELSEELETQQKMEKTSLEELASKIKADTTPRITIPKREKKADDLEIVDLHAEQIIENCKDLTSAEIITAQLARFTISIDLAIKSGIHSKIVFIHGVGSGRLKFEMQKILKSKYPKLTSQDASFKEYGYGAMMIFY